MSSSLPAGTSLQYWCSVSFPTVKVFEMLSWNPGSCIQSLSSWIWQARSQEYSCRCQYQTRLSYLRRVCLQGHRRSPTMPNRWYLQAEWKRICLWFYDNWLMSEYLWVGFVQKEKRRCQGSYIIWSRDSNSNLLSHYTSKSARHKSNGCYTIWRELILHLWQRLQRFQTSS